MFSFQTSVRGISQRLCRRDGLISQVGAGHGLSPPSRTCETGEIARLRREDEHARLEQGAADKADEVLRRQTPLYIPSERSIFADTGWGGGLDQGRAAARPNRKRHDGPGERFGGSGKSHDIISRDHGNAPICMRATPPWADAPPCACVPYFVLRTGSIINTHTYSAHTSVHVYFVDIYIYMLQAMLLHPREGLAAAPLLHTTSCIM